MSKFHVIVTNRRKPNKFKIHVRNRRKLSELKFALCLFVKGGTTEENFKRHFNVEYCSGTQKEMT